MTAPKCPVKIQTHYMNDQAYADQDNVRLLGIHTAEGARTDETLGDFMDRVGNVSYHDGCDDESLTRYVTHNRSAWALRSGNKISLNLCTVGFAKWSRSQWLEHKKMLQTTAWWIEKESWDHKIPLRKLSSLEAGKAVRDSNHSGGVIGHINYTEGTGDGTHWDPGPNFPWDVVMSQAQKYRKERDDEVVSEADKNDIANKVVAKIREEWKTTNLTTGKPTTVESLVQYTHKHVVDIKNGENK